MEPGDSYPGGQQAGGQRLPPTPGSWVSWVGAISENPVCYVWVRLAWPPMKISNKSGVLVPAGLLQTDLGNGPRRDLSPVEGGDPAPNAAVASGAEVSLLPCVQSQRCLGTAFQDTVPGIPSHSHKLLESLQRLCPVCARPGAVAAAGTHGWRRIPGASSGESQLCH